MQVVNRISVKRHFPIGRTHDTSARNYLPFMKATPWLRLCSAASVFTLAAPLTDADAGAAASYLVAECG